MSIVKDLQKIEVIETLEDQYETAVDSDHQEEFDRLKEARTRQIKIIGHSALTTSLQSYDTPHIEQIRLGSSISDILSDQIKAIAHQPLGRFELPDFPREILDVTDYSIDKSFRTPKIGEHILVGLVSIPSMSFAGIYSTVNICRAMETEAISFSAGLGLFTAAALATLFGPLALGSCINSYYNRLRNNLSELDDMKGHIVHADKVLEQYLNID
ncbi:MAG: hypothetical protein V1740_04605 [Candidatus Woesearchaeota archaeon]